MPHSWAEISSRSPTYPGCSVMLLTSWYGNAYKLTASSGHRWILAELWCFLYCNLEIAVEQTVDLPLILGALVYTICLNGATYIFHHTKLKQLVNMNKISQVSTIKPLLTASCHSYFVTIEYTYMCVPDFHCIWLPRMAHIYHPPY